MADPEERNGNGHVPAHTPNHEQPQQAPPGEEEEDQGAAVAGADEAELLWKLRKYLVLLAILAAAITYQAGLAPPGGFWQDNRHGHVASDIVLRSSYPRRYLVFFYCNTTAFVASLMVLVLLLVRELSRNAVWLRSLQLAMVLCLLGLMGAFAAGSCRDVRTSIYIWVLMLSIFAYVALHVVFFLHFAPTRLRKVFSDIHKRWKEILGRVFMMSELEKKADEQRLSDKPEEEEEELERNRSSLLVLATLAATVTYAAGLSPPGGFWSDDSSNHIAGDPMLRDHYPRRFKAFLICNATAFAGSLVIIIMILTETAGPHVVRSNALRLCVLVSLFGLMGAYAAGSCREVHTSIYVFALVGAVLLYLVVQFIVQIKYVEEKKNKMLEKLNAFIKILLGPEPEHGSSNNNNNNISSTADDGEDNDLQKLRTYLLLLGILAATVTFQAGLNPPGGFWTDNSDGHTAGDPILEIVNPKRYKAFFYCNATAFVASLVIIILLQSQLITMRAMKRYVLQTAMALVLFGLMGAYAAGSSRKFSTSIYVIVLVLLVFAYVVLHALLYVALHTRLKSTIEKIDESTSKFLRYFTGSPQTMNDVEGKDLQKRRKFLMLLAILAASVTYQAGISPPGGFWTDNNNGHRAGDPVFRDEFRHRYRVFFYFNATAFMASLAVILLLVSKRLCHRGLKCYALRACVLVDLISLMGAFAAGSCRKLSTSVYVILVVLAVFVYVLIQVLVLTFAKDKVYVILERMSKSFVRQFASVNQSNNNVQVTSMDQRNSKKVKKKTREHKWRKDLMLIGTLAITVTYQAGLLPPGGAWPDDRDNHFAGDPILHDTNRTRYRVFFYCNATAFMASMVMVILLLNNTISKYRRSLLAMKTAMVLDLLGLLGAYAAGSCRKFKTSAYIFALVIAVFIFIVIHVLLSFDKVAKLVKDKGQKCMPFLKTSAPIGTDSNSQPPSVGEPGQVHLPV